MIAKATTKHGTLSILLDTQQMLVGWKSSLELSETSFINLPRAEPSKRENNIY